MASRRRTIAQPGPAAVDPTWNQVRDQYHAAAPEPSSKRRSSRLIWSGTISFGQIGTFPLFSGGAPGSVAARAAAGRPVPAAS
jgi:hypothetical protein